MKDKIAFIIFMIFIAIFFGAWSIRAYTIVDTVYVPDSITVTMSWEEWGEYLEWNGKIWIKEIADSGVSVDDIMITDSITPVDYDTLGWQGIGYHPVPMPDSPKIDSDTLHIIYYFNGKMWILNPGVTIINDNVNTLCTDTTNFANLHFKDLEMVQYVVTFDDWPTPERQIFSDTNYTVDPATAIILNELMDCMEDYSYHTVVWYEEF